MKRRHLVLVDVTFNEPVTAKKARQMVDAGLRQVEWPIVRGAGWRGCPVRLDTKEGERAVAARVRAALAKKD